MFVVGTILFGKWVRKDAETAAAAFASHRVFVVVMHFVVVVAIWVVKENFGFFSIVVFIVQRRFALHGLVQRRGPATSFVV